MSDAFDADAIAKSLVKQSFGSGWITHEQKIADALRAREARGLERAAELCDARARHWHTDSSVYRELQSCAAAIRALAQEYNNNV